jgi:hypothetical protein
MTWQITTEPGAGDTQAGTFTGTATLMTTGNIGLRRSGDTLNTSLAAPCPGGQPLFAMQGTAQLSGRMLAGTLPLGSGSNNCPGFPNLVSVSFTLTGPP